MMKNIFLIFIFFYQKGISPLIGNNCRFYPSCSEYFKNCVKEFSVIKAVCLILMRILKCHPFHDGGYDPVPLNRNKDDK